MHDLRENAASVNDDGGGGGGGDSAEACSQLLRNETHRTFAAIIPMPGGRPQGAACTEEAASDYMREIESLVGGEGKPPILLVEGSSQQKFFTAQL